MGARPGLKPGQMCAGDVVLTLTGREAVVRGRNDEGRIELEYSDAKDPDDCVALPPDKLYLLARPQLRRDRH